MDDAFGGRGCRSVAAVTSDAVTTAPASEHRTRQGLGGQVFRWTMVALSAVGLVGMLALGRIETDRWTFEESVRNGDVESVTTGGVLILNGEATLRVDWSRGVVKRWSQVPVDTREGEDARNDENLLGEGMDDEGARDDPWETDLMVPPTPQDLAARWKAQGIEVATAESADGDRHGTFYSWRGSMPLVGLGAAALLLALGRVIGGPQPLRMRKWGWFWMLGVPLLGPLLFFVFGEVAGRRERQGLLLVDVSGRLIDNRISGPMGLVGAVVISVAAAWLVQETPFL